MKLFRKKSHGVEGPPALEGVLLGRRLAGEQVLPMHGADLIWPRAEVPKHALVTGSPGMGKSETAMRMAYDLAVNCDAQVFYLDAKGDPRMAERFAALMKAAGRRTRVFPNERFDAWRGDWRAVSNRLLEAIEFAKVGPAAYYRDIAKAVLYLACYHPDGPPRSSEELLARLDSEALIAAHGPSALTKCSLTAEKVSEVRMRYKAFFDQIGLSVDGEWSWEDTDAAYFMVDSIAMAEQADGLTCLLFSDFGDFFTKRKRSKRLCVLLVDEFAAIARNTDMARVLEQARSFGVGLVFIPQTLAGLDDRAQEKRIVGSVGMVVMHAHPEPQDLASLAGSRKVLELSHRYEDGVYSEVANAQLSDRAKVEPDWVRELPVGSAWVIRRGRAAKVAIERAPELDPVALPRCEALDRPLKRPEGEAPKELSYLDLADQGAEPPQELSYLGSVEAGAFKELPYLDGAEEAPGEAPKELSYLDEDGPQQ
jgi:Type IV secretory pathway, VirD4 components